ncbi:uncharacterized protein [Narcine bancroftii]|uniref:uncharacterized protein isoform X2 n=1 Tax=Narcine bancroftii TaxID=1343680 RepID=UPI0038314FD2
MQHRGCLQVAMDAVVGRRGSGQGSGVAVPALKQVALLLHLLIVVGAAPRPDCATGNTTGFRGERHITPAVGCTNLVETKLNFNLTLSHSNVTGASQDKDLDQTMGEPAPVKPAESVPQVDDQVTSDAQQSAGGSSTTARQSTKRKKDLGVLVIRSLNVDKTKEMLVDFRRTRNDHPLHINNTVVESIKFLGVHLTSDLKWTLVRKAQQRLHFLRRLERARLPATITSTFDRSSSESVLAS